MSSSSGSKGARERLGGIFLMVKHYSCSTSKTVSDWHRSLARAAAATMTQQNVDAVAPAGCITELQSLALSPSWQSLHRHLHLMSLSYQLHLGDQTRTSTRCATGAGAAMPLIGATARDGMGGGDGALGTGSARRRFVTLG